MSRQKITMVGMEKNGAVITIRILEKEKPVIADLSTGILRSYTGRPIKAIPDNYTESWDMSNVEQLIMSTLRHGVHYLRRIEPFLSYPDLLPADSRAWDLPNSCPKGYIKWLRENDKKVSTRTLEEFQAEIGLRSLTKRDKETIDFVTNNNHPWDKTIFSMEFARLSPEKRNIFNKVLAVSIKGFSWHLSDEMKRFFSMLKSGRIECEGRIFKTDSCERFIDTNRDFRTNLDIVYTLARREREKAIIKQENIIRSIVELSNEKFTIIVPACLEDFTNEGTQQNNCVGHYYHDSIEKGENLIYFIRHTCNPDKSYITNRYNIERLRTVETRKKNNKQNDDSEALALISEIDEKITDLIIRAAE